MQVLVSSTAWMEETASRCGRAEDSRIALYYRPPLVGFKIADFLKSEEILASVRGEAEAFRLALVAAKADRKAR